MIKNSMKNYLVSLKHFFTPLGTMFLGILIGISILIPGMISACSNLFQGIGALTDNLNLDFNSLWNNLWDKVLALDWSMPLDSLDILLSKEWMNQALTETLNQILGTDFDTFKNQIVVLVNTFTEEILLYIIVFFIWWILGFVGGYVLIRYLIRRNIAKRGLWKYILSIIIDSLLTTCFMVGSAVLFTLWSPSIFISSVLIIFLVGLYALIEAYLIHGRKKVQFRKIVNFGNVGKLLLTNFFILMITLAVSCLMFFMNQLLGIFVALSLFEIAFIVISLNAESYVKDRVHMEIELIS